MSTEPGQLHHPRDMGAPEVEAFLTHLAVEGNVAASTQNQALSALLFLYREVLGSTLPWMHEMVRAKPPARLPVVFTQAEVQAVLSRMQGPTLLLAELLYGTGLRLMECMRLRVKDVDFERLEILVRDGKGGKDRVTMLPRKLAPALQQHLVWRHTLYQDDLAAGKADVVHLPHALALKYPGASTQWGWRYIFVAASFSTDPRSGVVRRHHLDEKQLQRAFKRAVQAAGFAKPATTMIYTHVLNKGGRGVSSPLEILQ